MLDINNPGEMIYVFCNAFHSVKNLGPNLAESRNVSSGEWVSHASRSYIPCECNPFRFPFGDLLEEFPEADIYLPHKYDPLRAEKTDLLKIAYESKDQQFLDGLKTDLKNSLDLLHFGQIVLKIHNVNNSTLTEEKKGHDDQNEFEKNDDESEKEEFEKEESEKDESEKDEVESQEHDYTNCKKCAKHLSEQLFHGHLANSQICKIFI